MLIEQTDSEHQSNKYNDLIDKLDFIPLIIQIDDIPGHDITVIENDSKFSLLIPYVKEIKQTIEYIDRIFMNEGIFVERPILKQNNKINYYALCSQFAFNSIIYEKCNNIIQQIDITYFDFNRIKLSPTIKIILKFDVEKCMNENLENTYKLISKIERLEYASPDIYNRDNNDLDNLNSSTIKETTENIIVYI